MSRNRLLFASSFGALTLFSLAVSCADEQACTEIGCESGVTAKTSFSSAVAALDGSTVRFCRDDA